MNYKDFKEYDFDFTTGYIYRKNDQGERWFRLERFEIEEGEISSCVLTHGGVIYTCLITHSSDGMYTFTITIV